MIRFTQKGDYSITEKFLKKSMNLSFGKLDSYAKRCVDALKKATPTDTGLTAESWDYSITKNNGRYTIEFYNTNIQNGVPIAIILQYGHGTGTGGWVEGIDYINPAIQPLFNEMADIMWKEVTRK